MLQLATVDGEETEFRAGQVERDVGAAAQMVGAAVDGVEADEVGIDGETQALADRETDALDDMIVSHMNAVAAGGEQPGGDFGAVDLLQRDDVGGKGLGIAGEPGEVLVGFGRDVAGQGRVTLGPGGQPFEVPGRELELGAEGREGGEQGGQEQP